MQEIDSLHYSDVEEEQQDPTFIDNNVDVTEETKALGKSPRKSPEPQAAEEKPGTIVSKKIRVIYSVCIFL